MDWGCDGQNRVNAQLFNCKERRFLAVKEEQPIVELDGITCTYEGAEKAALHKLSLNVNKGEWLLIAGGSGSGKTTLCQLISGLYETYGGGKVTGSLKLEG